MGTTSGTASLSARECVDISIRVAATRAQRTGAFRLAYHAYLRAGLCSPNRAEMRITPYQLLPATDVIVAELDGQVVSTLSLVRDGELGLPLEAIYRREVDERRRSGIRMAEASCLADRRRDEARFFGLFCELCRVMVQMADREGIQQLLIAVHPRHARMYCRAMGFTQIGDDRGYPAVNGHPAVALCLDFEYIKTERPAVWERFVGRPLPEEVLRAQPLSAADCRYFSSIARGIDAAEKAAAPNVIPIEGVCQAASVAMPCL